jgi:hypothetical protein
MRRSLSALVINVYVAIATRAAAFPDRPRPKSCAARRRKIFSVHNVRQSGHYNRNPFEWVRLTFFSYDFTSTEIVLVHGQK